MAFSAHSPAQSLCGGFQFHIACDTSQLDEAIAKMQTLLTLHEQAKQQGLEVSTDAVGLGAAVLGVSAVKEKFSRRDLFGMRFLK